ncbi:MAG: DUF4115 domain-containing protein [Betaproteobacteria bacterium]|nr:DUF4115 domain-containing protein [Betaproteobacteria bacterium]
MENNTNQIVFDHADGGVTPPGALLAAAREARGLTTAQVAQALKLPVEQVQAMEAGDYQRFSPVFARGYLRSYARLLKVDIDSAILPAIPQAVRKTKTHLMHHQPGIALERKRSRALPALLAVMTSVVAGLAYYEFVWNAPAQGPVAASEARQTSRLPAPEPLIAPAVPPTDRLVLQESREPGQGAADGAREKALRFLFSRESWVEVRGGDGKILFSTVSAPGSERVVQGEPPFTLVIGAASGVELSYNGNRVDLASHVNEDVARLRLE